MDESVSADTECNVEDEDTESADPEEIVVAAHTRKKKRTLEELCAALPVEECVADLPEEERFNLRGTPLVCIGREYIRTELVMERAKVKVIKHYRKVYADRETELLTGESEIFKPELSAPLLPHSYVSASVAADILTKKYADGLPLYRQEQAWKRIGIPLRRGTMANWMIRISEMYFQPFHQRLHEELLKQAVIHADETVVQVLKEEGRSPTAESRMWVFTSGKQADAQIRCFLYSETRKGDCAEAFLNGYSGILVTDGYSGYNKVTGVTHAGCWAHMRRKWHEAMPRGESGQKSLAAQGYRFCSRLFAVERELEGLSPEERKASRQQKSAPILEAYWSWLETLGPTSGKLRDAVTYARNQKSSLCTFLTHELLEDALHDSCRAAFILDQLMRVIRVLALSVSRSTTGEVAQLRILSANLSYLLGDISRIPLVEHIPERCQIVLLIAHVVHAVVDGDKAHATIREVLLRVIPHLRVIASQTRQVLDYDTINIT